MSGHHDVRVIPIEIRPGEYVRIFGLPWNLTAKEAEKLGRVISAYALLDDDAALKEQGK